MRFLPTATRHAVTLLVPLLKARGLLLLTLVVFSVAVATLLEQAQASYYTLGRENLGQLVGLALISVIFEFAWMALWISAAVPALLNLLKSQAPPPWPLSVINHFNQTLVEFTRSLARILFGLPLIVPAIRSFVAYTWIPYIVVLDTEYHQDRIDALKRAHVIAKGAWWPTFFCLIFFFAAPSLMSEWVLSEVSSPYLKFTLEVPLKLLTETVGTIFLFSIFQSLSIVKGLSLEAT